METVNIGDRKVGPGHAVFIIAEVGVNHNGSADLAVECVKAARKAGADCVKFQTFKARTVAIASAPKANYQLATTPRSESQLEMLRKLELDYSDYEKILEACRREDVVFLSTPYSFEDADFLEQLGVPAYKIASGQIIEHVFLQHVARKNKPVLLSTGMATLAEVDQAVSAIGSTGNSGLVLLQCTTNYPSRLEDANLKVIETLRSSFRVNVGYSDHTTTPTACIASVALGACVVEKHFTLDKSLPGPDHSSSADPKEFKELVQSIRDAEIALGTGFKQPTEIEKKNAVGMRRSIVAKRFLPKGSVISLEEIAFKRPGTGLSPSFVTQLLGKRLRNDIAEDQMISWSDVE